MTTKQYAKEIRDALRLGHTRQMADLTYLNHGKIIEILIIGRVIFYLVLTSTKDVILNADA